MLLLIVQATLKITGTQKSQESDVTGLAGKTPREEPERTTIPVLTGVVSIDNHKRPTLNFCENLFQQSAEAASQSGVCCSGLVWSSPA